MNIAEQLNTRFATKSDLLELEKNDEKAAEYIGKLVK